MKLMRLAICVAAFALVGGIAMSEDMDVRALQAKLAAQEARLNDLQAKMYGASCDEQNVADGITSLRKNAVVTLGGTVNTRYFYRSGDIKSTYVDANPTGNGGTNPTDVDPVGKRKVADYKRGDMRISDAKLEAKIDVNEYFDAYLKLDLHDTHRTDVSGIAQNYWVRWKNVCNTGFGVLVGRDSLKFAGVQPYGAIAGYGKDSGGVGDMMGGAGVGMLSAATGSVYNEQTEVDYADEMIGSVRGRLGHGEGMFAHGSMVPAHTIWDISRVTQINPYWETQDGSFKAEMSLLQAIDTISGVRDAQETPSERSDSMKYRSVNYGLGSGTLRFTWKPVEGLKLVASAMNLHAKNGNGLWNWRSGTAWGGAPKQITLNADGSIEYNHDDAAGIATDSNNTSVNFAFEWRPCFLNRLNLWGSYTHGWNEGWIKDQDSDAISAGFGFDITDQLTFFAQGDYLRVKNDQGNVWNKSTGWGGYAGLIYTLPYGVNLEAGYRHDKFDYKDRAGRKHTTLKTDTIYAHLGFNF